MWCNDHHALHQKIAGLNAKLELERTTWWSVGSGPPFQNQSLAVGVLEENRSTDIKLFDVVRAFKFSRQLKASEDKPFFIEHLSRFARTIVADELGVDSRQQLFSKMNQRGLFGLIPAEERDDFAFFLGL